MEDECRNLLELARKLFESLGYEVSVDIYGSVSRDTWLAHEKDIDIFVSFPGSYTKNELEKAVTLVGVKILKKTEKRFAEHPYIRGDFKGYHVEIIPCYLVENGSKHISAVDRTPFHDSFVKKNLGNRQSEVRLLKQFMKGIGCYGAEIKDHQLRIF
jgi:tRNA nucleotidyltransferase (CCA-adding enzyme)